MKYRISLIFVFFSFMGIAQNCKLEINDIDPRTNLKIIRTEFEQLARINSNPFLIKAQSVGERKFLKIRYYRYNNFEIKPGSEMEFMLVNNNKVILTPYVNAADTASDQNSFMTVSSLLIFPIEPDDFEMLSTYDLMSFKYYRADGYVNNPVKEKKRAILRQLLNCIK